MLFQSRKKIQYLFVLIIFFLVSIISPARNTLRSFLFYALSPISSAVLYVSSATREYIIFVSNINTLRKENAEMKKNIVLLDSEIAKLKDYEVENRELRSYLSFTENKDDKKSIAQIVQFDPDPSSNTITIKNLDAHEFTLGSAVTSCEGALIGRISNKNGLFYEVILITDPEFEINVLLEGKNQGGILIGDHRIGIKLDLIPKDLPLFRGDRIVTDARNTLMPSGIFIGEVSEVMNPESSNFQSAVVVSPVDIKNLRYVTIVGN